MKGYRNTNAYAAAHSALIPVLRPESYQARRDGRSSSPRAARRRSASILSSTGSSVGSSFGRD